MLGARLARQTCLGGALASPDAGHPPSTADCRGEPDRRSDLQVQKAAWQGGAPATGANRADDHYPKCKRLPGTADRQLCRQMRGVDYLRGKLAE